MFSSTRNRLIWFLSILASILGILWLLERRWNQWFSIVRTGKASLSGVNGRQYIGRRITIQSLLECPADRVWEYACTSGFVHHVSWPLLRMQTYNNELPNVWHEGEEIVVNLKTLGGISLGKHTIWIDKVDREQGIIHSKEHGRMIQALEHKIQVQPYGRKLTLYTDDVRVYAGLFSSLLAWGVRFFYRYRQTRWQWLARECETAESFGQPV